MLCFLLLSFRFYYENKHCGKVWFVPMFCDFIANDSNLLRCFIIAVKCGRIRAMASPAVSAPKRETDPKKRVVITGMGLVSVFGSDIDNFYNKLLEGQSGISLIDSFDASNYSVRFAGQIRDFSSEGYIDGKNDRRLDNCWRYCLVAGKRALDDANLGQQVLETVSLFIGSKKNLSCK